MTLHRGPPILEWIQRAFLGLVGEEAGQATVEYGTIAAAILLGFFVAGRPMFIALLQGLQIYFESFYLLIRLPIP